MKSIIINNIDLMSKDEEHQLLHTLNEQNIQYKLVFNDGDKIRPWKVWEKNFYNAKKFFESKGNIKTRSALKTKWFKEYCIDVDKIERIE
jgi:GTP-binding protein EngB required for normal cell division